MVGEVGLTIDRVVLEPDQTKKTKDYFNTAYFVETEIRSGEKLKPMILNATNSKLETADATDVFRWDESRRIEPTSLEGSP